MEHGKGPRFDVLTDGRGGVIDIIGAELDIRMALTEIERIAGTSPQVLVSSRAVEAQKLQGLGAGRSMLDMSTNALLW
jgi:hypothetical protein